MKNKKAIACLVLCLVCARRADAFVQAVKSWWHSYPERTVYAIIGYVAATQNNIELLEKKTQEKKTELEKRRENNLIWKTLTKDPKK